jgi:hypothetical protein
MVCSGVEFADRRIGRELVDWDAGEIDLAVGPIAKRSDSERLLGVSCFFIELPFPAGGVAR